MKDQERFSAKEQDRLAESLDLLHEIGATAIVRHHGYKFLVNETGLQAAQEEKVSTFYSK